MAVVTSLKSIPSRSRDYRLSCDYLGKIRSTLLNPTGVTECSHKNQNIKQKKHIKQTTLHKYKLQSKKTEKYAQK